MCSQDWLRSRDELVEFTDEEGKKKRIRARVALLVHHKTEGGGPCYVTIVDQRTVRYFQWFFWGGIVLPFVIFLLCASLLDCFADSVRLNGNVQSTDATIANQDAPLFLTWRGFINIGRLLLLFPCTYMIVIRPANVEARLTPRHPQGVGGGGPEHSHSNAHVQECVRYLGVSGRSGILVLVLFVLRFFFIDAQLQSLEQRARCLNHSQGQHLAYVRSEERYKCFLMSLSVQFYVLV